MLDLEGDCGGSASDVVAWILDFSNAYRASTGRYPLLYTNPSWWQSVSYPLPPSSPPPFPSPEYLKRGSFFRLTAIVFPRKT